MSQGFIQLPRAFLESHDWKTLKSSDRIIFITILENAAFAPTKFNNHETIIDLNPGDLCISERDLTDRCAPDITYKMVRGALERLSSRNLISQNRAQRRAQQKMIISITNPTIYNACFLDKGAKKGAVRAQPGRTKQEDKEDKEQSIYLPNNQETVHNSEPKIESLMSFKEKDCFFVKSTKNSPHKVSRMKVHEEASKLGFFPDEINKAIQKASDSEKKIVNPIKYILGILNNKQETKNEFKQSKPADGRTGREGWEKLFEGNAKIHS